MPNPLAPKGVAILAGPPFRGTMANKKTSGNTYGFRQHNHYTILVRVANHTFQTYLMLSECRL